MSVPINEGKLTGLAPASIATNETSYCSFDTKGYNYLNAKVLYGTNATTSGKMSRCLLIFPRRALQLSRGVLAVGCSRWFGAPLAFTGPSVFLKILQRESSIARRHALFWGPPFGR